MIRALAKIGYAEDHRVLRAMDWLLSKQLADGAGTVRLLESMGPSCQ